jgi:quercetin dioxygenase-like cupin family protein
MGFIDVNNIRPKEIVPGFHGRFYHSANMTIAYWEIKAGSSIPVHNHIQEMVVNVIEGNLELTIDKETRILEAVIPSNVPHTAKGISDCRVIDIFHPSRPEYNNQ